jgi:threonine/homoserine/homoserine lactone efflux protein
LFELSHLYWFMVAGLALLLVPGPAVLYIVARSVTQGRSAGLASVLGIETASLFHTTAAALGLSAILMSSALAFDIVKYLGAAYLVYLGIRKLIDPEPQEQDQAVKRESLRRIYSQGVVVNLLNPKTALFFFAFLPQFVDTSLGNVTAQVLFLGLLFITMATITDSTYALLSSLLADRLKGNQGLVRGQRYLAALVYVGLGVTTALSGSNKN